MLFMRRICVGFAGLAGSFPVILGLLTATPASATSLTYIDFVGTCDDCANFGLGVLTLQNFTSGALTAANFVDFTYQSSLLSFDITSSTLQGFNATFGALPGLDAVDIQQTLQTNPDGSQSAFEFTTNLSSSSFPNGLWRVDVSIPAPGGSTLPAGGGGGVNFDVGEAYSYTLAQGPGLLTAGGVPEPATWALMIAGFGLAGAGLRRRRALGSTV